MKKFFSSTLLIFSLVVTLSMQMCSISFAYASNNNSKILVYDSKANDILKENFSKEELRKLEAERKEQDRIEAENGFIKRTTEVIISQPEAKNYIMKSRSNNKVSIGDSIYYVNVIDTYTGKEEILNKSSKGMAYWLDVTWNLTIGKTKHLWKACTVLGLNPSNFLSDYEPGDKLSSNKTKVVARRCYKKYNPTMKKDMWYLETRSETIKNYVDLYTFDKNHKSVRKSKTDTKTFYSYHYSDTNWIKNYVNNACLHNQQVYYTDQIK